LVAGLLTCAMASSAVLCALVQAADACACECECECATATLRAAPPPPRAAAGWLFTAAAQARYWEASFCIGITVTVSKWARDKQASDATAHSTVAPRCARGVGLGLGLGLAAPRCVREEGQQGRGRTALSLRSHCPLTALSLRSHCPLTG
jgi:hypothetical protein